MPSEYRGDHARHREHATPALLRRVVARAVAAEDERRAAQHDPDEHERERDVQHDAKGGERRGEGGEEQHDDEDEPHVIRFPDRPDLRGDQLALRGASRAAREQVPHAAAEVRAAGEHVRVERQHHDRRENLGKSERVHFHGRASDVSRTSDATTATTTAPSPRYSSVKVTIGTTSPGIGVTACAVRMSPCTIHGCRPTSVTIHPASVARKPNGATRTSARRSQRSRR